MRFTKAVMNAALGLSTAVLLAATIPASAEDLQMWERSGGNKGMVGWKWIGYPGDPMRRGDAYYKYIFKPGAKYPYEHKPLPMMAAPIGAARPGGVEQQGQGFVPKKKGGK